jgi:insertion element IS1 protein InsB
LYCSKCDNQLIKYGFTKIHKQRYLCKECKTTAVNNYKYNAYNKHINENIVAFTREGVGIRSTARLLKIAINTVLARIKKIAKSIIQPAIPLNQTYEVDELCTFVKHKENRVWIVYAFCRETGKVVSFNVGKRTNKTLNRVIQTVENARPKQIITDKLKNYRYLIDINLHSTKHRGINHIERMNLTLRTHLKRLNRRSLAYSKSILMLSAVLKIYFWC